MLYIMMLIVTLLAGCATTPSSPDMASEPPNELLLETPLHILAPDENTVTVPPGIYRAERGGEQQIRLTAIGSEGSYLLPALPTDHNETVSSPSVLFVPAEDDPDLLHLVLLLPEGQGLDATASLSGVRPRGTIVHSIGRVRIPTIVRTFGRVTVPGTTVDRPIVKSFGRITAPGTTLDRPIVGTFGRVPGDGTPSDPRTVCDRARNARAQNSPAAPNLEAQCRAATQSTPPPVPISPSSRAASEIEQKLASLLAGKLSLGAPTGPVLSASDGIGAFRNYQFGAIYWAPQTGAHEIHGAIREKWMALGAERYGYPLTDELQTPDERGRFNIFRSLSTGVDRAIAWWQETGAFESQTIVGSLVQEPNVLSFMGHPSPLALLVPTPQFLNDIDPFFDSIFGGGITTRADCLTTPLAPIVISRFVAHDDTVPPDQREKIAVVANLIASSFKPGCKPLMFVSFVGHADQERAPGLTPEQRVQNEIKFSRGRADQVKQAVLLQLKDIGFTGISTIDVSSTAFGIGAVQARPNPAGDPGIMLENRRVEVIIKEAPLPLPLPPQVPTLTNSAGRADRVLNLLRTRGLSDPSATSRMTCVFNLVKQQLTAPGSGVSTTFIDPDRNLIKQTQPQPFESMRAQRVTVRNCTVGGGLCTDQTFGQLNAAEMRQLHSNVTLEVRTSLYDPQQSDDLLIGLVTSLDERIRTGVDLIKTHITKGGGRLDPARIVMNDEIRNGAKDSKNLYSCGF